MARKHLMTWIAAGRRWIKKHKGKMYAVSCRQLGVTPETKEASASAANEWWEAREKEIATAPPTEQERRANAFRVWSMVQDWEQLDEASREKLVDSILGPGQFQAMKGQADALMQKTEEPQRADRTLRAQVDGWLGVLRAAARAGQMSGSRYDSYRRTIEKFVEYVGAGTPIDAVDETRVEGFFTHLSVQVAAEKYSPSYAHTLMMTARQFIAHVAEKNVIPAPGNLRSRRFRFNHTAPAKVEVFEVGEVRALLTACDGFSERTKLYLLLMLNCGMYQNDVSDLLKAEVNWKDGTITRARSKTRHRGGPVVTYQVWPETFGLLKKHRAKDGELALTTDEGKPLVFYGLVGEETSRYDVIQSAWNRLAAKMQVKKIRLGMKHLRKTSATLLASHPQYKYYVGHFLADSPRGMDQRHYVKPSDPEFFEALAWLRLQLLGE